MQVHDQNLYHERERPGTVNVPDIAHISIGVSSQSPDIQKPSMMQQLATIIETSDQHGR